MSHEMEIFLFKNHYPTSTFIIMGSKNSIELDQSFKQILSNVTHI